jgi:hypothetical protein
MSKSKDKSPAARVMDEAVELAIEERSPYPEKAAFLDADEPTVGADIRRAADEGRAIVLVAADGARGHCSPSCCATSARTAHKHRSTSAPRCARGRRRPVEPRDQLVELVGDGPRVLDGQTDGLLIARGATLPPAYLPPHELAQCNADVAVARKLSCLFWCLLTRGEDYAHQQPSLTVAPAPVHRTPW